MEPLSTLLALFFHMNWLSLRETTSHRWFPPTKGSVMWSSAFSCTVNRTSCWANCRVNFGRHDPRVTWRKMRARYLECIVHNRIGSSMTNGEIQTTLRLHRQSPFPVFSQGSFTHAAREAPNIWFITATAVHVIVRRARQEVDCFFALQNRSNYSTMTSSPLPHLHGNEARTSPLPRGCLFQKHSDAWISDFGNISWLLTCNYEKVSN